MEPIRIAYLAACPREYDRLGVEAEYRYIESELDRAPTKGRFDCRFEPSLTRSELLRKLLRIRPHVVHFGGHGTDRDELLFEDDEGRAELVSGEDLKRVFSLVEVADRPKIVVLSACYSAQQADALVEFVDCAVGISLTIRDSAARAFARGFYLGLVNGLSIRAAVAAGQVLVPAAASAAGQLPKLHEREGADLDQPLLAVAGPVSRFPSDLHIDRAEELAHLRRMLATGDPRLLLITANGLMGKSELMGVMEREAAGHPCVLLDITQGVDDTEGMLARMAQQLRLPPPMRPTEPVGRAATGDRLAADPRQSALLDAELQRMTRELLAAGEAMAGQDRRLVILLDGFDTHQGQIASWVEECLLPEVLLAQRTVCVVAGRVKPRVHSGRHLVREEVLGNFHREDIRTALRQLRLDQSDNLVDITWVRAQKGNPFETRSQLKLLWETAVGLGT